MGINLDGIIEEAGRAAEIEVKLPEAVRQFCNVDCGKVLNNSAAQHIENIADAKKIYDSGNTHEVKSTLSDRSVKKTVVAVAKDEAFCFYYEDNLDLLKKLGAEIQYFSPIHDRNLPVETCAVCLGGGYPELHAKALSENISMRNAIRQAVMEEMPCIAECGGYLYLKDSIVDPDGVEWPMAGVLPGSSRDTGKLGRFGYITVTSKKEGLLGPAGTEFRAHEFHHWDSEENGTDFAAKKPVGTRGWDCGYTTESFYAGFPHLYFYSNVKIAENFIKCAETWKKKNSVVK